MLVSRWVTTLALEQEAVTVKELMHVYLHVPYPAAPRAQRLGAGAHDHELVREDLPRGVRLSTLTVLGSFLSMILIGIILAVTNLCSRSRWRCTAAS